LAITDEAKVAQLGKVGGEEATSECCSIQLCGSASFIHPMEGTTLLLEEVVLGDHTRGGITIPVGELANNRARQGGGIHRLAAVALARNSYTSAHNSHRIVISTR
jgi:hypothetical protein